MREFTTKLILFLALFTGLASANNFTLITGSKIQDSSGALMVAGQISFQPTDSNDQPTSFMAGGGGQVSSLPVYATVTNGVIGNMPNGNPLQVADSASTTPAGISYRVTVRETGSPVEITYRGVQPTGSTWSFDSCVCSNATVLPVPTPAATSGNFTVNGNESVTGALTVGSFSPTSISPGTLTVSGASTLNGTVNLNAGVVFGGSNAVTGTMNLANGATIDGSTFLGGTTTNLNLTAATGRAANLAGGSCASPPCSGFNVNITGGAGQNFSFSGNGGDVVLSGGNPGGSPIQNGKVRIQNGSGVDVWQNSTTCGSVAVGLFGSLITDGCSETGIMSLNTSGTTTDSGTNVLPSSSSIEFVMCRVTTTITTAANWSVGDASSGVRFAGANTNLTAGTTSIIPAAAFANLAAGAQTTAAKIRITTNANPGAGAIRCVVFYRQGTAPTS